jgi:hypothetical protein
MATSKRGGVEGNCSRSFAVLDSCKSSPNLRWTSSPNELWIVRIANPVQTSGIFEVKSGFLYIGLITNDCGNGGTDHCGCPLIVMVVRKIVRRGIRSGPL